MYTTMTSLAPWFAGVVFFVIGTVLGSWLNVVVLRFASTDSIVWARSRCPSCRRVLRWWELLPLVSYLLLGGRCRRCDYPISAQYPLVELGVGVAAVAVLLPAWHGWVGYLPAALALAVVACLIVLGLIDWYTFLLPDRYLGILLGLVLVGSVRAASFGLTSMVGGAAVGSGFLLGLWLLTRGQGIGLGDVKLMVPLGILVGLPGTITLLFLAFVSGGLVGLVLLGSGKAGLKTAIPFGPFLVGAAIVIVLYPALPHHFFSWLGL